MTGLSSQKYVVIVGPTASGKTELGIKLAQRFNGEIVCADSRTLYRGMDIGTAKPTADEQAVVAHHLLDVVEPDQPMSAAVFKQLAGRVMKEIRDRQRIPFLIGGSGLYVYSVVYDFVFPAGARSDRRIELEKRPLEELVAKLEQEDPERAAEIDVKNARRVIRALETLGQPRERAMELPPKVLLLGLKSELAVLSKRIDRRTKAMFEAGLVDEVRRLVGRYGDQLEVLKSPGYGEILPYLRGEIGLEAAENLVSLHTRQLVKRQFTWLRRNHDIVWLEGDEAVEGRAADAVGRFLSAPEV